MPKDSNSQGISAVTAVVLLMALIEVAYFNSTYTGAVLSIPIAGAGGLIALSMFIKLAYALGINNKVVDGFDRVLSIVPLLTVAVFGYQALNYWRDGLSGFMAIIAIGGLVGAVIFGLTDGIAAIFGEKYKKAMDVVNEGVHRAQSAADAIKGTRPL